MHALTMTASTSPCASATGLRQYRTASPSDSRARVRSATARNSTPPRTSGAASTAIGPTMKVISSTSSNSLRSGGIA